MDPQDVVDIARNAMMIALITAAPVLLTGMIVGLLIGLLQALTQVQEQTVNFVPKLVAMLIAGAIALPWIIVMLQEYVRDLYLNIPNML